MSETIRDVLIKVSIQNGNLALGPIDTTVFEASVRAAKEYLEKMIGGIKIDPLSVLRPTSTSQNPSTQPPPPGTSSHPTPTAPVSVLTGPPPFVPPAIPQPKEDSQSNPSSSPRSRSSSHDGLDAEAVKAAAGILQLTKGIAQMAVATETLSGDTIRSISQLESFSSTAISAYATLGPIGVGIAAIGAGYTAILAIQRRAMELSNTYWDSIIRDSTRVAQAHERGLNNQFTVTELKLQNTLSVAGSQSSLRNVAASNQAYSANRAIDARTDITPEQKAELRRRTSTDSAARASVEGSDLRLSHLSDQQKVLEASRINPEKVRKTIQDASNNKQNEISQARNEVLAHISGRANNDTARYLRTSAEGPNAEDYETVKSPRPGQPTTLEQERLDQLSKQSAEAKQKEAEELKGLNELLLNQARQEQSIQEQIAKELENKHKTLQQIKEDAADAVRREKEGIRGAEMSYGAMNQGDKLQVQELEKKGKRIAAQRAAKEAGENVEVEEFNQHEVELGLRARGKHSFGEIERQIRDGAQGDAFQSYDHNQETLRQAEQRQHETDKFADPSIASIPGEIQEAGKRSQEAAQKAMELITNISTKTADSIEKLLNVISECKKQVDTIDDRMREARMVNRG